MRSVTYSMGVSLDGYIVGADGGFDWTVPDEEVFRFWINEIREVGVHLMGRRLWPRGRRLSASNDPLILEPDQADPRASGHCHRIYHY